MGIEKIYLDEVREIYDLLKNHCEGNVEIKTSLYKFANVEELRELNETIISDLSLSASNPNVSVDFGPASWSTGIYAGDDSPHTQGLIDIIAKVILKGKRRCQFYIKHYFEVSITIFAIFGLMFELEYEILFNNSFN